VNTLADPRQAKVFRFVGCSYADGEALLRYAFDEGPELIERVVFPEAPALPEERKAAFSTALQLLHLVAGVSYYKAGVPGQIRVESAALDAATAGLLDQLYLHGLGEFAYQNKLDLRDRLHFPHGEAVFSVGAASAATGLSDRDATGRSMAAQSAAQGSTSVEGGRMPKATVPTRAALALNLPRRTLVPIGGGKDSLVSVELLKSVGEPATAVWVGNSPLISACAAATGWPTLNIGRQISPLLFELNRLGAWNGHIPVTAINSAILIVAALLYGYDAIAFSNERSASSATLEYAGGAVNHQWSKSLVFERALHDYVKSHIAADLDYFSLLRPWSELEVTRRFAQTSRYDMLFSSCNRNFRILGPRPADRWCGQCPKCHFVFLALAPFMPKPRLLSIFGRNYLDDETLAGAFDALLEYGQHKPFECVGEGLESRAAIYALSQRPEWREDALVARFAQLIAPQLDSADLALDLLLRPSDQHLLPARLASLIHAPG
jgi:UDP-N-acetyl-alpha-D-muramoyl-L-alanyl-L-glutamate epimerase